MLYLVRDVQLKLLRQKSLIKSTILFWLINDGAKVRELVEATDISHDSDFNFAWTIEYEKAIGKMGAFAHCGS